MSGLTEERVKEIQEAHDNGEAKKIAQALTYEEMAAIAKEYLIRKKATPEQITKIMGTFKELEKVMPIQESIAKEEMLDPGKTYEQEMAERLQKIKRVFDKAYIETKHKYNKLQADTAVTSFFLNSDYGHFTGEENRKKLKELLYHPNEMYQVLLDFAISTYIFEETNGIKHDVTLEEVKKYSNDKKHELDYSEQRATSVVALATAWSPFWAVNLLSLNQQLMQSLVRSLVKGRYGSAERRNQLDNSRRVKMAKQPNGKVLMVSKYNLNKDIANMNRDDMIEPYDPDKIAQKSEGRSY